MPLTFLKRRILKLAIGSVILVLVAVMVIYHLFMRNFGLCGFNDGPFFGRTAEAPPGSPIEEKQIFGQMTLQVFSSESGNSPILVLKGPDERLIWAIYADGHAPNDTTEVHLTHVEPPSFLRDGRISGSVKWTYGNETADWYISKSGKLGGYCYSW
jgi:hypothetical protein